MKKATLFVLLAFSSIALFSGCKKSDAGKNGDVYVYNWGEYIDEDVIDIFEEETGIKVHYDTFVTNEDTTTPSCSTSPRCSAPSRVS